MLRKSVQCDGPGIVYATFHGLHPLARRVAWSWRRREAEAQSELVDSGVDRVAAGTTPPVKVCYSGN
eukprot:4579184-Prymnesium_polylepis.1